MRGDFPVDVVYILPTMSKPTPEILVGYVWGALFLVFVFVFGNNYYCFTVTSLRCFCSIYKSH